MSESRTFADAWPTLAADLDRYLRRAGVPAQERADVVQETAARLLRTWSRVETAEPVEPLARTVALNIWRDQLKSARRREVPGELPEVAGPGEDVERRAVARLRLERAVRVIGHLPAAQREALRRALAETGSEPRSAAERMALMRARRAVAAALRPIAVLVAWLRPRRRAAALAAGAGTVALAIVLLPATPLPDALAGPTPRAEGAEATAPVPDHGGRPTTLPAPVAAASPGARVRPAPPAPRTTPRVPPRRLLPIQPPVDTGDQRMLGPTFESRLGDRRVRAGLVESSAGPRPCVNGFPELPYDTSCRAMSGS